MSNTGPPKSGAGGSEGSRKQTADAEGEGVPAPGDLVNRWRDDLFGQISRRPAQSLLVAVGAGYLAGGGLGDADEQQREPAQHDMARMRSSRR